MLALGTIVVLALVTVLMGAVWLILPGLDDREGC